MSRVCWGSLPVKADPSQILTFIQHSDNYFDLSLHCYTIYFHPLLGQRRSIDGGPTVALNVSCSLDRDAFMITERVERILVTLLYPLSSGAVFILYVFYRNTIFTETGPAPEHWIISVDISVVKCVFVTKA